MRRNSISLTVKFKILFALQILLFSCKTDEEKKQDILYEKFKQGTLFWDDKKYLAKNHYDSSVKFEVQKHVDSLLKIADQMYEGLKIDLEEKMNLTKENLPFEDMFEKSGWKNCELLEYHYLTNQNISDKTIFREALTNYLNYLSFDIKKPDTCTQGSSACTIYIYTKRMDYPQNWSAKATKNAESNSIDFTFQ
jgi:hypothetical protein